MSACRRPPIFPPALGRLLAHAHICWVARTIVADDPESGAIVTIARERMRVRPLPIVPGDLICPVSEGHLCLTGSWVCRDRVRNGQAQNQPCCRIFRRAWGFSCAGDLNPETGEISPNLDLNSKTGEKSPDRGVHAGMLAGMPRLASSAFR